MIKLNVKLALLLLCAQLYCSATENTWDKRTACGGSKRERGIGFVIGNRGYVGLGQDTLNLMCNDLWEFDPGTNSWTQKANFPGVARRDAAAFAIGNKGYVGTGIDNADALPGMTLNDFWEYSPVTNSWTSKAPVPGAVYYATGFAINGKGYLCCGKIGASNYTSQLLEYNPTLNTWTSKAYFPGGPRYGAVAFVIDNIAYLGTGTDENIFTTDFYKYNPLTNMWTAIAPFPGSGRFSCSSFVLNGNGYVVFGTDGGYKDELWIYVPEDNYWYTKASFPGGARRSAVAFTIGNRAFAGTGKGFTGTRRDFWQYTPMEPVGILERNEVFSSVYPNPVSTQATIVLSPSLLNEHEAITYRLSDMMGRTVRTEAVTQTEFVINRDELASGHYTLSLYSTYSLLGSKKVILQ
jgi:N-acetylneuraminic acid mutarotase